MDLVVKKPNRLSGEIIIPSDKSISHRAVIFASLACGKSVINNFSSGKDPHSSLEICKQLGVEINIDNNSRVVVNSTGKLCLPDGVLDCGNSGTTMRLMSGILAGQDFSTVLSGDLSLSSRPMKRIIEPLSLMGAKIESENFKAPLRIFGRRLHSIDYTSKIASAQVKSCVLLAGMNAQGTTTYTEPYLSRNHTEIMLCAMGANIQTKNNLVTIEKSDLRPIEISICGDISSAAYFIVAGLIIPNSKVILKNVGLNPTRAGIIEVCKRMGANIEILDSKEICGELVGDIKVEYTSQLNGVKIEEEIIPTLIDEIPVICVLASQAKGETIISGAFDLRNKESDRIKTIVNELTKLGANIIEKPDGMIITGKSELCGGVEVNTYNDHRLAMSMYVAGLICKNEILIKDFEWVNISFPEFEELFSICY